MTEPEPSEPSFFTTVREAIRGTEQDLTAVPIRRAVILLAVPTVLEMSMESVLTIVDIFVVSRLGANAVATVGLTESMLSLMYALAMGLSAGATAMVSRRMGQKDPDGAARAAVHVIGIATVLSIVLGAVGAALSPHLLGMMGASPEVVTSGSRYTGIMLGGSATIFLLFVVNAVFRSAGDAAIAMRSLVLANGLNLVLAPLLVFGWGPVPRLGVTGAAVATTVSRGVGIAYQIVLLAQKRGRLQIGARHLHWKAREALALVRVATPAAAQVLVETASWLGLVRILSGFGSVVLAGYTIAMRVAIFAMLPSWGLAGAAATLVGQNLGAKAPERAQKSVESIALYNVVFLGGIGLLLALFPGPVVGLVVREADVRLVAASCLRIVALGFFFFAFGMVMVQAFNGAGDTKTPMLVNLGCFWALKLPLAYALSRRPEIGETGVFVAISIAYMLHAVLGAYLFRRGRWKERNVLPEDPPEDEPVSSRPS